MRRVWLLPVALVVVVAGMEDAAAHSGGTDEYGCHVDSRTGLEHCHDGGTASSGGCGCSGCSSRPDPLPRCSAGQRRCASYCVDLNTDRLNCGECFHVCGAPLTCVGATCTAPPLDAALELDAGLEVDSSAPSDAGTGRIASLSMDHQACAVLADGRLYCWGRNDWGQIGDGTQINRLTPVRVAVDGIAVSTGRMHTCALVSSQEVACWGDNTSGQLGAPAAVAHSLIPRHVDGLPARIVEVAAAGFNTCALSVDGNLFCWGRNLYGEVGDGTGGVGQERRVPSFTLAGVRRVFPGLTHFCAELEVGPIVCWGRNDYGQLGDGTLDDRYLPTHLAVLGGRRALDLSLPGIFFGCALLEGGLVGCWGQESMLGSGSEGTGISAALVLVEATAGGVVDDAERVSVGGSSACVLRPDSLSCWNNRIGSGSSSRSSRATVVPGGRPENVVVGTLSTCAVYSGELFCWGDNEWGQLGVGDATERLSPAPVAPFPD